MTNVSASEAYNIAKACQNAFSYEAYANGEWAILANMLADLEYDAEAIEQILRSKWTRWARNDSPRVYGHHTADDVINWLKDEGINPKNWHIVMGYKRAFTPEQRAEDLFELWELHTGDKDDILQALVEAYQMGVEAADND